MAFENKGKCVTMLAESDLSASQFHFVTLNGNARIALTGDGGHADGVLQDKPAAQGRAAQVMVGPGFTKVVAGAVTTAGGNVGSDSTGRAVDTITGDASLGKFMQAAGAAGDVVTILFQPKAATAS